MTNYIYFCPICRRHYIRRYEIDWYSITIDSLKDEMNLLTVTSEKYKENYTVFLTFRKCKECEENG